MKRGERERPKPALIGNPLAHELARRTGIPVAEIVELLKRGRTAREILEGVGVRVRSRLVAHQKTASPLPGSEHARPMRRCRRATWRFLEARRTGR